MKIRTFFAACLLGGLAVIIGSSQALSWSLEEAAKPYAGTTVDVVFLLTSLRECIERAGQRLCCQRRS